MAKISLIISIIITLATAGLAFMTRKKVDDLQSSLKSTKNTLASTQTTLKKTQNDLTAMNGERDAANKKIEEQTTEIVGLKTDVSNAKSDLEKATAEIKAKEAQLAEKDQELAKVKGSGPDMSAEDVAAKIASLEADKVRLTTEVAEQKQIAATLNDRVTTAESQAGTARAAMKRYTDVVARQGLTGRVVAVNPGWNFVVVDVGDRQGAMINAPLLVMRDGQAIARLKVTSVEPTSSIADVVPGTLARGQSVQPGDRVVFARQTTQEVPATPEAQQQGGAPAPGTVNASPSR